MGKTFEGLCALVNKEGICWQCKSFRQVAAEDKRGPLPPVLNNEPWSSRLKVVKETHFVDGVASGLHSLMFRALEKLEDQAAGQ